MYITEKELNIKHEMKKTIMNGSLNKHEKKTMNNIVNDIFKIIKNYRTIASYIRKDK